MLYPASGKVVSSPVEMFRKLVDYAISALVLGQDVGQKWAIFWKQTKNVRVRLRFSRHNPNRVYSLRTIYGTLYFRDNFGDITNLANLFYRQVYQIREVSHPGPILDIGANIGLAAAWFARFNPNKKIYCFEPLQGNADIVKLNCPSAQIHTIALGARRGRAGLQVDADGVMASSIPMKWATSEELFEVMPLDDFFERANIREVALLKLDAEGMEIDILKGASRTLRNTHAVVMETHGQSNHENSLTLLRTARFHIDREYFSNETGMVFASRRKPDA